MQEALLCSNKLSMLHLCPDGRLEDGYLAWSSIYLHEYFGFTIYTPLTPEQQSKMKQHDEYIPHWIDDFSSLPNLAIPLSYFCIGVALQLLRTPLIVYFIQDRGASAAEVNVLFTVSKSLPSEVPLLRLPIITLACSLLQWRSPGASKLSMVSYQIVCPYLD
jgi:hypothetical protein